MEIDEVMAYAATFPYVEEEYKPDWESVLLKVGGKMFVLIPLDRAADPAINLKCDPEWAEELRMRYEAILPGFHMNKRHWNTVRLRGNLPQELVHEMIRHSYDLVYKGLTEKVRHALATSHE